MLLFIKKLFIIHIQPMIDKLVCKLCISFIIIIIIFFFFDSKVFSIHNNRCWIFYFKTKWLSFIWVFVFLHTFSFLLILQNLKIHQMLSFDLILNIFDEIQSILLMLQERGQCQILNHKKIFILDLNNNTEW